MIWWIIGVLLWVTVGQTIGAIILLVWILWHAFTNAFEFDRYIECWREIMHLKYHKVDLAKFVDCVQWLAWALVWPIKFVDMWIDIIPSADQLYHERFDKEGA